MKSQTSLVASNVRLQEWAAQIHDCQNRPNGMDVITWCQQHQISKATYYYRLRKVREAFLDLADQEDIPSFVEIPVSRQQVMEQHISASCASLTTTSGIKIELYNSASESFLQNLLRAAGLC